MYNDRRPGTDCTLLLIIKDLIWFRIDDEISRIRWSRTVSPPSTTVTVLLSWFRVVLREDFLKASLPHVDRGHDQAGYSCPLHALRNHKLDEDLSTWRDGLVA